MQWGDYYVPDPALLYSAQVLTQQLYPRFIDSLRDLAGGGLIMLPASEADLHDPQTAADIARSHGSPAAGPVEKVRFFKLAWDAIGGEFASRHVQYQKFYAGANFVTRGTPSGHSTGRPAHAWSTQCWRADPVGQADFSIGPSLPSRSRRSSSSQPPTWVSPMKICGTEVRPPARLIDSARSGVPCGASISRKATPLLCSRATARAQKGHQGWV